MEILDKLQSNVNLIFKLLKGMPGEDVCWVCEARFTTSEDTFCPVCSTYKCPECGVCYCSLPESAKKALDSEMYSVGLWNPYHNPPKRKRKHH